MYRRAPQLMIGLALLTVFALQTALAEERTMKLEHEGGQIAYDIAGESGPLIIAIPGIGDLRSTYRHITPALLDSGFRVLTMDLRGQGESSMGWEDYSSSAVGEDVIALIDELGDSEVYLIGNSLGGAASVVAATQRPDVVKGIVMLNPFVRDAKVNPLMMGMVKLMLSGPWGVGLWVKHYNSLYVTTPPDHEEHVAEIRASLKRSGRLKAFRKVGFTGHAKAATFIDSLTSPVTVMMGMEDSDIGDTQAALEELATDLHADTVAVPGAGHYLHAERPELVVETTLNSIRRWQHAEND